MYAFIQPLLLERHLPHHLDLFTPAQSPEPLSSFTLLPSPYDSLLFPILFHPSLTPLSPFSLLPSPLFWPFHSVSPCSLSHHFCFPYSPISTFLPLYSRFLSSFSLLYFLTFLSNLFLLPPAIPIPFSTTPPSPSLLVLFMNHLVLSLDFVRSLDSVISSSYLFVYRGEMERHSLKGVGGLCSVEFHVLKRFDVVYHVF